MARPKLYPHSYYVRLSDEGNTALVLRVKNTGQKPAIVLREIAEKDLLNLKEGDDVVQPQEKAD